MDFSLHGFGDNAKLRSAYTGIAAHLGIGSVVQDALISVSNQEFVDIEDGLIGTNVFSQFLVAIDFAAQKLRLVCRVIAPTWKNRWNPPLRRICKVGRAFISSATCC